MRKNILGWLGAFIVVGLCGLSIHLLRSLKNSDTTIREGKAVDSPISMQGVATGRQPFQKNRWKEIVGLEDEGFDLGPYKVGWSTGGLGSGYLYLCDMNDQRTQKWEFAPCESSSLEEVLPDNVTGPFYGTSSPEAPSAYQYRWHTNAVQVYDGAVVLLRPLRNTNVVYALQMEEQDLQRARIRFRAFDFEKGG